METIEPRQNHFLELMHHDEYKPAELAELVGMDVRALEQEVFQGKLRATVLEHQVISIRREDALNWLRERAG